MVSLKEIIKAYKLERISETYHKPIEITDLQEDLETKGHVLVIRGDKAYTKELSEQRQFANPKFWLTIKNNEIKLIYRN